MDGATLLFLLIFASVVVVIYAADPLRVWRRYRGVRLVTCPETSEAAAVRIDVAHAATTAFIEHEADVRLASCSRWPARGPCRAPCLPDVIAAGGAGSVRAIVERWYAGKTCRYCGERVTNPASRTHRPALVGPDGITTEWSEIAPEHLPALFSTHGAVCWTCHVAESFRRLHPNLHVDRQDPKVSRNTSRNSL